MTDQPLPPTNEQEKVVAQVKKPRLPIKKKEKSWLDRLAGVFIGEDFNMVGDYLLWEVLIPAAKDTISEMVSTGIKRLLYGGGKASGFERTNRFGGRAKDEGRLVPYDKYSSGSSEGRKRKTRFEVAEIPFDTKEEASAILNAMEDILEEEDVVSIADYYALAEYDDGDYTDTEYGWTIEQISRARPQRHRDGWTIVFPRPILLK